MPYADRRILIYMEDTRPVGYDAYGPVFHQLPSKMVGQHRRLPSCDEKRNDDYVIEPSSPRKNNSPKEVDGSAEQWNEKYNKIIRQSESPRSDPQRYTSPKKEMYFSQYRKTSPRNYDLGMEKGIEKEEEPKIQHMSNGSSLNINDKAISPRSSSRGKCSPIRECTECFCRGCVRSHNIDESAFREKVKIDDKTHGYVKPCLLACCYDRNTIYKQNHYDECKDTILPYGGPRHAFTFQDEDIERRVSSKKTSFPIVEPSSRRSDSERRYVDMYTKNSNTVYRAYKSYGLHKAFYASPRYSGMNHDLSKGGRIQEDDVSPHWQKIEYNNIRSIYEGSVSPRNKFRRNSGDSIRIETKIDPLKDANVEDNYGIEKSGFKRFLKTSPRDNQNLLSIDKYEEEMSSRNSKEKPSNVIKWQSDSTANRNCPPKRTISTTPPNCHHKVCSNESAKNIHDEYKQPVIGYNAHGGKFSPISHSNGVYYHSNNQSDIKHRIRSQSHTNDGYLIRANGTNPYNQIRHMNISPNNHRYLEASYYRSLPTMTSELTHQKRDEVRIHDNPMLLNNHCNGDRFMAIREHHHLTPPPPKLLRVPPDRGGLPSPEMITTVKQRMYGMFGGASRMPNEQLHQVVGVEKKRTKSNKCLHLWQFLRKTLDEEEHKEERCIEWTDRQLGEFRLINTAALADRWGQSKNSSCMTYEKMARAMRYYYNTNILEKVPHKRLHFRFSAKISTNILQESKSKDLTKNENNHVSTGDGNHSVENKNDIKDKNVNENKNDNDPKINDINFSSYNDWKRKDTDENKVKYKNENDSNLDNFLKQKNDDMYIKNEINGQDVVSEQKLHLNAMRNEDENNHDKTNTQNSIDDNQNKCKDDVVIILSDGNQKYRQHDVFLKKEIDDVTNVTSSHLNVPISTVSGVWSDSTSVEDLIIDTDSD